jgi:uncharacterized protein YlxP (DUF503 family)
MVALLREILGRVGGRAVQGIGEEETTRRYIHALKERRHCVQTVPEEFWSRFNNEILTIDGVDVKRSEV